MVMKILIGKGKAGDQLAAALDNQLGVGKHPPAKQQRREQTALDKVRSRTSRTAGSAITGRHFNIRGSRFAAGI